MAAEVLRKQAIYSFGFVTAVAIVLFSGLIGFNHNDHMYSVSSVLQGELYHEINYVQAPLSHLYLRLVASIAPDGQVYITLRFATIVLLLLTIGLASLLVTGIWTRVFFLLLAASNSYLAHISMQIGSYALPLFFVVASMVILLRGNFGAPSLFFASLFIGLATATKLNHLLFFAVFLPILFNRLSGKTAGSITSSVSAVVFGALPGILLLGHFWLPAPDAFMLHNVIFHSNLTNSLRGLTLGGSFLNLASGTASWLSNLSGVVYIFAVLLLVGRLAQSKIGLQGAVALWYLLIAYVAAISPMVIFPSYLAPATLLALAVFMRFVAQEKCRVRYAAWGFLLAVSIVSSLSWVPSRVLNLRSGIDATRVEAVNRAARNFIDAAASESGCENSVYSLSGAFLIDSGAKLSSAMAAGIFWARLRGLVPEEYFSEQRWGLRREMVFPEVLINQGHVNFVLTGFYSDSDAERAIIEELERQAFVAEPLARFGRRELRMHVHPRCERWRESAPP